MIDIRELRKDPGAYRNRLSRKGADGLVEELLQADAAWRRATTAAEALRAKLKSPGKPTPDELQELQRAKEQLQETESSLAELERRRKELLDRTPNPPADDVPSGGEDDFDVLREVGTKPSFGFAPRDHLDLAQAHGWIDAARGTKVSGSRFIYRIGDLALLELALYRYALARVTGKEHILLLPPCSSGRKRCMAPASSRPRRSTSTGSSGTSSTSWARPRCRSRHSMLERFSTSCPSATSRTRRASGGKQAQPARTRAACSASTNSTNGDVRVLHAGDVG